jgi:glycosyltransferase involved in cell wall biosynthesis
VSRPAAIPVLLNWGANGFGGWGIVGLNLFYHWAHDPDLVPLLGAQLTEADVAGTDPLRIFAMRDAIMRSNAWQNDLRRGLQFGGRFDFPVIEGLGNGLFRPGFARGSRTIGRCIFEDTNLQELDVKLANFDVLVCASRWNAELLQANCRKPVRIVYEGIDPSLFHPTPKSGLLDPSRFYVFSGGKVEFRKGHDLTVIAFREFARRHDDAVLVTLWHSPWPHLSAGFTGRLESPLSLRADGYIDVMGWVEKNGIDRRQVIELPQTPNTLMPAILREMDCALAPSRAEACTNLLAKEAMACGVPVIAAANTGVLDLISDGNVLALTRQSAVQNAPCGSDGWGESDPDEIVAALETLYTDTDKRGGIGRRGAEWIVWAGRTWASHAAGLKSVLLLSI